MRKITKRGFEVTTFQKSLSGVGSEKNRWLRIQRFDQSILIVFRRMHDLFLSFGSFFFLSVAYIKLPDEAASDDWYLANAKMVGLYRVNYEDDNWHRLLDQAATDPSVIIDYLAYLSIN